MEHFSIFDYIYEEYKIDKPIRLIECFAGYGSQALALKYLGANFEHWLICEWAMNSIIAYADLHREELKNYGIDYTKELDKDTIAGMLEKYGVSIDYNNPAKLEQLKRVKEDKLRLCLNSIIWEKNLVDISRVKGQDLVIEETEKFTYLLTYSFPCQDLSLAGKGAGMERGSGTRSGLLWEVERILTECKEKPQVLLMENVSQIHNQENMPHFKEWILRLEELGYQSYWNDLSATEFGIPQTRNRTFMISILGDYNYKFPKKTKLKLILRDLLEKQVDKKYYLNEKQVEDIRSWNAYEKPLERAEITERERVAPTLTTRTSEYTSSMILIKNATRKGYLEANIGDGIDISSRMETHRGTVQKNKAQTITTMGGENVGTIREVVPEKVEIEKVKILGNYSPSGHEASRIVSSSSYPTFKENHGTIPAIDRSELVGGFGNKGSTNQYRTQNRVYSSSSSPTLSTAFNPYFETGTGLSKLTPRECYRLMGLKDRDIDFISEHQNDRTNWHLAGDSIVVTVLMAIFSKLLNKDWQEHFNYKEWWNKEEEQCH